MRAVWTAGAWAAANSVDIVVGMAHLHGGGLRETVRLAEHQPRSTDCRRYTISAGEVIGLPPIAGGRPVALFLGNAPSVLSLASREYYGNPRNAFWPIMGELLDFSPASPYPERTAALISAGYAVWDVLAFCRRPGSLDSAVERDSMVVNHFESFFAEHPSIERVFFTGGAAEANYRRLVAVSAAMDYLRLPSTSPAHTIPFEAKLAAWRACVADTPARGVSAGDTHVRGKRGGPLRDARTPLRPGVVGLDLGG